jgi:hypothetical protein
MNGMHPIGWNCVLAIFYDEFHPSEEKIKPSDDEI